MKKLTTLIFLISFGALVVNAQTNLVPNGSFEQHYACPNNASEADSIISWHSILNTPDYFDTCATNAVVSVPSNFMGNQFAFQGAAYVGIYTFSWFNHNYREIIGTKLLDTFKIGTTYHCSMRVSRGNWTNMSYNCSGSNKLGMRFTTYPYSIANPPAINNFAQLHEDSIINDTINWVLLHWDFVADSNYKYLSIGNFFDDANTDTSVINAPIGHFGMAYYFIDSVNVFEKKINIGINEVNPFSKVYYNAIAKEIIIKSEIENGDAMVYDIMGRPIATKHFSDNATINTTNFLKGIYFIKINSSQQSFTQKLFIY